MSIKKRINFTNLQTGLKIDDIIYKIIKVNRCELYSNEFATQTKLQVISVYSFEMCFITSIVHNSTYYYGEPPKEYKEKPDTKEYFYILYGKDDTQYKVNDNDIFFYNMEDAVEYIRSLKNEYDSSTIHHDSWLDL